MELYSDLSLFQEGLKVWAHQIMSGVCLFDGRKLPEDTELTAGQVCINITSAEKTSLHANHVLIEGRQDPVFGVLLKGT